jgi:hypothetical protein
MMRHRTAQWRITRIQGLASVNEPPGMHSPSDESPDVACTIRQWKAHRSSSLLGAIRDCCCLVSSFE